MNIHNGFKELSMIIDSPDLQIKQRSVVCALNSFDTCKNLPLRIFESLALQIPDNVCRPAFDNEMQLCFSGHSLPFKSIAR